MSKKILKTRTQFTSTLKTELYQWLQQHSKETGIPISKLLDQAVGFFKLFEETKKGMNTNVPDTTMYQSFVSGTVGVTSWLPGDSEGTK